MIKNSLRQKQNEWDWQQIAVPDMPPEKDILATKVEKEDPGQHVHWDSGKPIGWDEHVAFMARQYGFTEIKAVAKGVEYKVAIRGSLEKKET